MVFTCCVPTCNNTNKNSRMHSFPHRDLDIYNIWINRIGNEKLTAMDPTKVNKNYRVCDNHFSDICHIDPKCCGRDNLVKRSLPTLHLPNFSEKPTVYNSMRHESMHGLFTPLAEIFNEHEISKNVKTSDGGTKIPKRTGSPLMQKSKKHADATIQMKEERRLYWYVIKQKE